VLDLGDDEEPGPGAPGVPPAPSVTPGSAPPPPAGTEPAASRRGCALLGLVLGVVGLVVVGALVVVLAVAEGWIGDKAEDLAQKRQDVVDETGIATGSTDTAHPPQRDVSIGACEFDGAGGVKASGTLTNWTEDPADYRISLSFRDGGGGSTGATGATGAEFGATTVTVEGVEEHTTTNWSASVPVRPEGTYTCRIVRIDRWVTGEEPPPDGGS
jgi:hypothetical protein